MTIRRSLDPTSIYNVNNLVVDFNESTEKFVILVRKPLKRKLLQFKEVHLTRATFRQMMEEKTTIRITLTKVKKSI